jgi:hypothetical protein
MVSEGAAAEGSAVSSGIVVLTPKHPRQLMQPLDKPGLVVWLFVLGNLERLRGDNGRDQALGLSL